MVAPSSLDECSATVPRPNLASRRCLNKSTEALAGDAWYGQARWNGEPLASTLDVDVQNPLLSLGVILDRTRGGSYVVLGLTGIALFGVFLFLTYYLQEIKGYSPVASGLLFLPFVGGILVTSTVSTVALPRVGPRALIASGLLLSTGAMAYLIQLTATSSYAAGILPAAIVLGLGFGVIFAVTINTATAGVRREDAGVASALVNTMQQVGGSIGLSALSTVALTATASYLAAHHTGPLAPAIAATHGYTTAFAIAAAILCLGVILAIVLLPSRRRLAERETAAAGLTPAPAPQPEPQPAPQAIPVALCGCSPMVDPGLPPAAARPPLVAGGLERGR
jgi:predicted MFS family arabinose efflux permease